MRFGFQIIMSIESTIPKGVPANPERMNPELVGSETGEIPLEHQDIHVETRNLAIAVEQNVISLTDALLRIVPNLEQRLERVKDAGVIGGHEYEKLSDDLYAVKEQIVEQITATISELILHPEQITGDKNEFANLLKALMEICEGATRVKEKN